LVTQLEKFEISLYQKSILPLGFTPYNEGDFQKTAFILFFKIKSKIMILSYRNPPFSVPWGISGLNIAGAH
jgi:hypothetical protein